MGRSVNKVQIIGTLGRDPELRYLPNSSAIVTVSVATDESYSDKTLGQKVEKTEWHRMTAFGKLAEIIGHYLKKGSKAYFEGKLRTNEYEKDGIKRYSTEIVVNDMMMLGSRPDNSNGFAPGAQLNGSFAQQGGFAPQGQPAQQPMQQGGYSRQPQGQPAQQRGFQPHSQPMSHTNNFDSFDDDIPF